MTNRIKICIFLFISLILAGCNSPTLFKAFFSHGPSSANTSEEMFTALIGHLTSMEVKDLQGTGDTWQGYDIWLRFTSTDSNFINRLIQEGYQEIPCDSANFSLPNRNYDIFKNPTWGDLKTDEGKCFFKNKIKNAWTHFGSHYFYMSPQNNLVYFHGTGA